MALRASIDIGSNTTLLLAAELNSEGLFNERLNETRVTSLGKDLDKTGEFREKSMTDTFKALVEYKDFLKQIGISAESVLVTATEAARVASNSKEFFQKVKNDLGFNVTIINGEGEAYYTSYGVISRSKIDQDSLTIMDIGGASTELIRVQVNPFKILKSVSLPLGSVRCSDWLKERVFDEKISDIFKNHDVSDYETDHLLCVAGSMTSLGSMIKGLKKFDSETVNGTKISFADFLSFTKKIKKRTPTELLLKFPFSWKKV